MDSKLHSILTLALRPETAAGEVAAATAAARRLVARNGLDALLDEPAKEKIVYRYYNKEYTERMRFKFPRDWYSRVASDMLDHACKLKVYVCPTSIETVDVSLNMIIEICGNKTDVEEYVDFLRNLYRLLLQQELNMSQQQKSKLNGWFGKLKEFVS